MRDHEAFKVLDRSIRSVLPVKVDDVLTVGNPSVARCTVVARHTGHLQLREHIPEVVAALACRKPFRRPHRALGKPTP